MNAGEAFQYVVVRYRPDAVREEFVNIGVIAHAPETGDVRFRYDNDLRRALAIDPDANLESLRLMTGMLDKGVAFTVREDGLWPGVVHAEENGSGHMSMLFYSDVRGGVMYAHETIEDVAEKLFERFVP